MTFPMNDDLAERELSASELDAISAGLVPHGPLPPIRAPRHYQSHPPPRYYPGGGPNAAGLQIHH